MPIDVPPQELGPIAVWIIVGMGGIIGTLVAAVVYLFRRLLDRAEKERDEWKLMAQAEATNVADLTPSVAKLTTAVEAEHRVAAEGRLEDRNFREEWRNLATEVRDGVREVAPLDARRRRPRTPRT